MRGNRLLLLSFVVLFATSSASADDANASPSIHRIPDPASGYGALSQVLMPANVALREELNISPPQLDELRKIEETYQQSSDAIMRAWIGRPGQPLVQNSEMTAELQDTQKQIIKGLGHILREEQFRRLRQIDFQRRTQFNSLVPLSWKAVMTELALAPDEQTRFAQQVKTRSEALQKSLIDLQQQVPNAVARLATPEQRQKLDELYGEPLEDVGFYDNYQPPNSSYRGQGLSSVLSAARSPIIAKELEILDDQAEKITTLAIENRRLERGVLQKQALKQREATQLGKGNLGPPVEELKALREAIDKRLADILLPHQIKRLRQLDFQIRVAREAPIPLLSKTAATAIGLTEEKQAELKEAYARESFALLHEQNRVFHDALDELLKTLSPEQQKRYHLLVGKRFDKWFE